MQVILSSMIYGVYRVLRNGALGLLYALILWGGCQSKDSRTEAAEVDLASVSERRAPQRGPAATAVAAPQEVAQRPEKQKTRPGRDFTVGFFGMTYKGIKGNLVDELILAFGAFEKPILFFMRDAMQALKPEGGVFLDVGANSGQHSLFMSKYSKVVHAVEPYEPVLRRLREMIEINRIENIVVHPVGLGDKPGKVSFYEPPPDNLGTGSFVDGFKTDNKYLTELPIVTGDSLFAAKEPIRIDIIKMDIEGYEALALRGLKKTLRTSRPIVVMEVTIDPELSLAFRSEEQVRNAFPKRYDFYWFSTSINKRGNYKLVPFQGFDFTKPHQKDVVAVPREIARHVRLSNASDFAK
jgi:FkbM family methyltransferase